MIHDLPVDIDHAFETETTIDDAMNQAVQAAVNLHKRAGIPLVIWRDGKIVEVMADEITPHVETSTAKLP
jgi:hypothetical protein